MTKKILVLPGDGIGPETMREALRVMRWLSDRRSVSFEIEQEHVGGASLREYGVPIKEHVIRAARSADAVLFGAVGSPEWAEVGFDKRPEVAILTLRQELELFANLRPAVVFSPLIAASTLKPDVVQGLDIMIVRESVGGVYFGKPRGIEILPDGTKRGINTEVYSTEEILRVARVAFTLARARRGLVHSVEKSNVMESGLLWKEVVTELHGREFADVRLEHMYADNCAMQLVRNPRQFDVIVTGNLFGDVLSDLASMLTGSLGMLPSATLGQESVSGHRAALYEPIHGSAPDIAGTGKANPLAQILSLAMMLRYSLDMAAEADLVERACAQVLEQGIRTPDIMEPGAQAVGTEQMGQAVVAALDTLNA